MPENCTRKDELSDLRWELRRRFMADANGDPIAAIDTLLDLLWQSHSAATDGAPVPYNRWLLDGGPATMPADIRELRDAYDTLRNAGIPAR